ncbi:hypothetical protein ZIOFF_070462 [Zingiber officinale]|uniref:Protein TAR1 n=1 Tax=Zingiber officinale TaxID=94328 RepID=A0A8J5C5L9_ZINOF|nr:hypothetical protein ZIOFF_070462 [Zingiber officinale]
MTLACQTPWSVFQGGSNRSPGRCLGAGAVDWAANARPRPFGDMQRYAVLGLDRRRASVIRVSRAEQRVRIVRGHSVDPIRFPRGNFKYSLTLFSKSFSSFPRGTCSLSVSRQYLALDEIYRPTGAAFPNNPTRRQRLVVRHGPGQTGSPSHPIQRTWAKLSRTYLPFRLHGIFLK